MSVHPDSAPAPAPAPAAGPGTDSADNVLFTTADTPPEPNANTEPADDPSDEKRPTDTRPTDTRPAGTRLTDSRPAGARPASDRFDDRPAGWFADDDLAGVGGWKTGERLVAAAKAAEAGTLPGVGTRRGELTRALAGLRDQLGAFELVLDVPGVEEAREQRLDLRNQLVDYALPRIEGASAPMLVVLGGSTGAGKSTLVNTLVGSRVSATGVLRPTTSSPILVCHPDHAEWFLEGPLLPGMGRVKGPAPDAIAGDQLVVITSEELPPGLALLDSPDFDSVFEDHYEFATKLMAAADVWLCVVTASRYADAMVWQMLERAREQGATVGVVLSRVQDGAGAEVVEHFGEMLGEHGVGDARRFIVPETRVEESRLPEEAVEEIRSWMTGIADDPDHRRVVIGDTLGGVLDSLRTRVPELAEHVKAQVEVRAELAGLVESAYGGGLAELDEATRNGSLLRGEVLARWQDFAGTGDLLRSLRTRRNKLGFGRRTSRRHRSPVRVRALKGALRSGLEALIVASAEHAAEQAVTAWREHPAGRQVLAGSAVPGLGEVSPELSRRVSRAVSSWQDHVQELVRTEGVTKRSVAKIVSFDTEALALVLMIGLLGYGTSEVNVEGGTSAVPQRLLKALFGAESLRGMGAKARADLRSRIAMLFDEEGLRFGQALDAAGIPDETVPVRLYQAVYNLEVAR
ncbi:AAA family ATPase [Actinomadura logoneensis]|uniref:AAA family ATPase n=2 Tax=Actinomadura logoneensis TaxID=2293572 RepID=A0A372JUA2_9ACTN|nr:AAA family ATPase [Actinomadura logoneensis]